MYIHISGETNIESVLKVGVENLHKKPKQKLFYVGPKPSDSWKVNILQNFRQVKCHFKNIFFISAWKAISNLQTFSFKSLFI